MSRKIASSPPFLSLQQIVFRSDLVIEAASAQAVGQLLPLVIRRRKSILVMSTGGLLAHRKLLEQAKKAGISVYLPSGALIGLDGIKAAAVGSLKSVTLTTRKPPRALAGAPGVSRRSLSALRSPRIIFQGSAAQAVKLFPQNINVAATLALAGIGPRKTRVRIIADPAVRQNSHEVEAVGSFGRMTAKTQNVPARQNPKTSRLAVFSAVATLQQILQPVRVGT